MRVLEEHEYAAEVLRKYAERWSDDPADADEYTVYSDIQEYARRVERGEVRPV